jgi:phosphate transport system protein
MRRAGREIAVAHDGLLNEIRTIDETVMQLAVFVEELIATSMTAMARGDDRLADEVMAKDREADAMRAAVRRQVIRTIECWAPVGIVLRKIIASQLIADELERIGDYAVHVARVARVAVRSLPLPIIGEISELARLVRQQVREGVRALALADEAAARKACALDAAIDADYWHLLAVIQQHMRDHPDAVPVATELLFAIRDMERIGDRIANICEDVIYSITGTHEKLN